jgi:CheY-like chemotaxis protein
MMDMAAMDSAAMGVAGMDRAAQTIADAAIHVAIVSASALFAWRLARALESYDFSIVTRCDGADNALRLLCRERVDLLLAVHQPPHLDAVGLGQRLRAQPDAVSRHCSIFTIVNGMENGMEEDIGQHVAKASLDGPGIACLSGARLDAAIAKLRAARNQRRPSGWTIPHWG